LRDIAPYYGELERGFAATHLPRVGTVLPSIGFSTLAKVGWAIADRDRVIGKAVCTAKRGGSLKIGPIAILPDHRNRGHATSFLRSIIALAHASERSCVFATVPAANLPARRSFENAGFHRAGALVDHYRSGSSEDIVVYPLSGSAVAVGSLPGPDIGPPRAWSILERIRCYVAEQFFPVDETWGRWLDRVAGPTLGEFERKPHDVVDDDRDGTALVIYKRGGTAKVIPVVADHAAVSQDLLQACELAASRRGRRKVSVFLPADVPGPAGYRRELVATGYSVRGPIAVWSRQLG
jgi:GNAT superfamily N-acetyltransferase